MYSYNNTLLITRFLRVVHVFPGNAYNKTLDDLNYKIDIYVLVQQYITYY